MEPADKRQLDYANALFGRKLYDLAIPEYEKFLGQYPPAPDRATRKFLSRRMLPRAQTNRRRADEFQSRAQRIPRQRFRRPGGLRLAEILFNQKDYERRGRFSIARPRKRKNRRSRFPRDISKRVASKISIAKKRRAIIYLQVVDAKTRIRIAKMRGSRSGTILLEQGRKADALSNTRRSRTKQQSRR